GSNPRVCDPAGSLVRAMPRTVLVAALVAGMALWWTASASALSRTTANRPDDISGAQVHALYFVPSDGADRAYATDGPIAASVATFRAWLKGQTGGQELRADTFGGQLDISFVRLTESDATIAAKGLSAFFDIEDGVHAAGFTAANKIYEVYYDGTNTAA